MIKYWALLIVLPMLLPVSASAQTNSSNLPKALERALVRADAKELSRLITPTRLYHLDDAARSELLSGLIVTENIDGMTMAVRQGLDPNQILAIDVEGETVHVSALNFAIGAQVASNVALRLIALGADVSRAGPDENQPLLTAVSLQRYELVRPLLDHGADPNSADKLVGATPLMVLFATSSDEKSALEIAKVLVAGGGRINDISATKHTPLMMAAQAGNAPAVEWLLNSGANPTQVTDAGETALSLAQKRGHMQVATLLTATKFPR